MLPVEMIVSNVGARTGMMLPRGVIVRWPRGWQEPVARGEGRIACTSRHMRPSPPHLAEQVTRLSGERTSNLDPNRLPK